MKKFVDMYGYKKDYYCPSCHDSGFFRDDLSGGESYCTCEAGQSLYENEQCARDMEIDAALEAHAMCEAAENEEAYRKNEEKKA
jgi:hypothetical protein